RVDLLALLHLREKGEGVGPFQVHLVVKDVQPAALGKQAKIPVGNARGQIGEYRRAVLAQLWVAQQDQVRFQVLGQHPFLASVVDQAARQVQLLDAAAAPVDDLGGQHSADTEFLAKAEQRHVDAGRINVR